MGDKSNIEWTDATWNPIVGCSIVSPGCTNCYAMKMAARIERMNPGGHYDGMTKTSKAGAVWTGNVALAPDHVLTAPCRWAKPRRIFVNSMGDLFHEDITDTMIDDVVRVMALTPNHTYQVLTKRAARMHAYMTNARDRIIKGENVSMHTAKSYHSSTRIGGSWQWPLPNVWLGVSTERQQEADERIPLLLQTPAAVRFISAEPLLGPIDLRKIQFLPHDQGEFQGRMSALDGGRYTENPWHLNWVIVGGESGPGARSMHPNWARSLRDQCAAAGLPFFFKQWGNWSIGERVLRDDGHLDFIKFQDGDEFHVVSDGHDIVLCGADDAKVPTHLWRDYWADGYGNLAKKVGKKDAGRLLDGKEHNGFPQPRESLFS